MDHEKTQSPTKPPSFSATMNGPPTTTPAKAANVPDVSGTTSDDTSAAQLLQVNASNVYPAPEVAKGDVVASATSAAVAVSQPHTHAHIANTSSPTKPALGNGNPNTTILGAARIQPPTLAHPPHGPPHIQKAFTGGEFGMPSIVNNIDRSQPPHHAHAPQGPPRPQQAAGGINNGMSFLNNGALRNQLTNNFDAFQGPQRPQATSTTRPNGMTFLNNGASLNQPTNPFNAHPGLQRLQSSNVIREAGAPAANNGAPRTQPVSSSNAPQGSQRPQNTAEIRNTGNPTVSNGVLHAQSTNSFAPHGPPRPQIISTSRGTGNSFVRTGATHAQQANLFNAPQGSKRPQNVATSKELTKPVVNKDASRSQSNLFNAPQGPSRQKATVNKDSGTPSSNDDAPRKQAPSEVKTLQDPARSEKPTIVKDFGTAATDGTARFQLQDNANAQQGPPRAPKATMSIDLASVDNSAPRASAQQITRDIDISDANSSSTPHQASQAAKVVPNLALPANPVTPSNQATNVTQNINSAKEAGATNGFSPMVPTPQDGTATMAPLQPAAISRIATDQSEADSVSDSETLISTSPSIYPKFNDGDVLIMSPTGKSWKLHSMVLSNASIKFKELFNTFEPYPITKKMRAEGATIRWRLIMWFEDAAHDLDPNSLQFKSFRCIKQADRTSVQISNINGLGAKEGYNKLYDNLFRCMYNLEPIFTDDVTEGEGREFILDASTLLQAAVFLDAVPSVRIIIEAHLLRLNQLLWHHISNRPEGWVHLAARLESPLMFREAMLHIVGKFHLPNGIDTELLKRPAFGAAGQQIWLLIQQKAAYLKQLKLNTERHLLEYYPTRIVHKEDQEDYVPGRATYANDIYLWMALTLLRQYIGSSYAMNFHHRAADGGLAFYRTLGTAPNTYLRKSTLEAFHRSFDMSSKGKACLKQAVDAIKDDIKPCLGKLLVDRSQATRSPNAPRLKHLTCTEIADHELPWYTPPPPPAANDDVQMGDAN